MDDNKRKQIYEYMIQKGFTHGAAVGMLGNIAVETGYTYDYRQKQKGGNAYGLFQFDPTGPHDKHYQAFLKKNEMQDSMEAQVDYVYDNIYGDSRDVLGATNADRIAEAFQSGSIEDATNSFLDLFERPKNPDASREDRLRIAAESDSLYGGKNIQPLSTNVDPSKINYMDGVRKFMQNEMGGKWSLKHSMYYGFGMKEELNSERNKEEY